MTDYKKISKKIEIVKNTQKDQPPAARYFPGKVPKWADNDINEDENNDEINKKEFTEFSIKNSVNNDSVSISVKTSDGNDRRLKRLQQLNKERETSSKIEERVKNRREIYKSEIIEENPQNDIKITNEINNNNNISKTNEGIIDTDENAIYLKRQELKKKLLSQHTSTDIKPNDMEVDIFEKEDITFPDEHNNANLEEHEEMISESEISSDEKKLLKPIFVTKDDRITIKEKLQKELEDKADMEMSQKQKERKKKETKQLVLSYIQKDLNGELDEKNVEEIDMPDDTDEPDNTTEYESWKIRELKRIKRNEEENQNKIKEIEEIERRRNLTDDQRKEENLRLGSDDTLRPFKSKYKFMQKFYKMGVFYQDQGQGKLEHIFNRDYNLPIG